MNKSANLQRQFASTPTVERLDRYRFRLDGREVDFRNTVLDHGAAIRLTEG